MGYELEAAIKSANESLHDLHNGEIDLASIEIETQDSDGYIFVSQSLLGWISSIYVVPGAIQILGIDEFMYRLNEVFEASAARIANSLYIQFGGAEVNYE